MLELYDGTVVIGQDLLVLNVKQNQINCRMAITDKLIWAPPAKTSGDELIMDEPIKVGRTPSFVSETRLIN